MIKVISVDDHEMISYGLDNIFSETSDIKLIKYCRNKAEFEEFIKTQTPEEKKELIAIIDLKLEQDNGFDCADFAVANKIDCFIYSSYSNTGYIIKAMEHKVRGYLTKNADKAEIFNAIRAIKNGETYIQKNLLPDMMFISSVMVTLTKKEKLLTDLLIEHLPNEIIAERMNISKRTVENYVSRIFDKFNVKNRWELEKLL